jgi:hypothetical protein
MTWNDIMWHNFAWNPGEYLLINRVFDWCNNLLLHMWQELLGNQSHTRFDNAYAKLLTLTVTTCVPILFLAFHINSKLSSCKCGLGCKWNYYNLWLMSFIMVHGSCFMFHGSCFWFTTQCNKVRNEFTSRHGMTIIWLHNNEMTSRHGMTIIWLHNNEMTSRDTCSIL